MATNRVNGEVTLNRNLVERLRSSRWVRIGLSAALLRCLQDLRRRTGHPDAGCGERHRRLRSRRAQPAMHVPGTGRSGLSIGAQRNPCP